MKTVFLLAFIGILGALAAAGLFMLRNSGGKQRGPKMARALAVRVGVSVALFLFILLSYYMGWIQPTGVPLTR
ncbi:DUF2909 domain-containing protein [Paucibacter sp. PLA-PC-4]|uniref:DUF2909 domain-containing protein n=1 Tax=Paucibacter sp. PLA-PC-4 TaxID=2993655 RepID=UPI002248A5E9|nr:DUF2909 domain-containing protein [Paucibacter sp. PLA-PC-4]MCX2861213.1 DUF2909 domain-containing protein [Paucibacter sp. PLA-PC-4]